MRCLAHISEDKKRQQSIKDHLLNTADRAKEFAEEFGYGDWGYCCGMLHDIGKYSEKFQERIRGSGEKVDHATAGAQLCYKLGTEKDGYDSISAEWKACIIQKKWILDLCEAFA